MVDILKQCLKIGGVCIGFYGEDLVAIVESFTNSFSRRYLPDPRLCEHCNSRGIEVSWIRGQGFNVVAAEYYNSSGLPDRYIVEGGPVEPYVNESPVFFLLQALSRRLLLEKRVVLTDSITIHIPGTDKAILLLGYPHTGKSTIASIAYSRGFNLLSTENTVVEASDNGLYVKSGSSVLVYDPRVKDLYEVRITPQGKTRHGYEIIDINNSDREKLFEKGVRISSIYILHTSFSSSGVSLEPVKGRKISKTLWYFATGVLKGVDFYEPAPLDMPLNGLKTCLLEFLNIVRRMYEDRVFEVFGSPLEVFNEITRVRVW
ncbi:hypothetical protein DKAM_0335 [Desulfurococcus amylolyticus 1221n]|uniref:Uncharacterized protein n=1 Tax=Desulfurococcus amylolyticus (strain DSM 18924 / JCM 16383 / VKM B-2413 / 1221n) TaxID=490899 RepID=B8D3I0_DESA1|nr:hypothetical protein DKAM_0335 [Desulfurococcus amylolyticus 1221n]